MAYVFPQTVRRNADFKNRQKFAASVDEIEAATNLNFFPMAEKIGGQKWKRIEEEKVMDHWVVN